jgi:hypothetical protein
MSPKMEAIRLSPPNTVPMMVPKSDFGLVKATSLSDSERPSLLHTPWLLWILRGPIGRSTILPLSVRGCRRIREVP